MEKTFYYYNCFITHNDDITNIHLSEMLDDIIVRDPAQRLKNVKQGYICLMNMKDPNTNNNDSNDRKLVFGKFRDNKPFLSTVGTDRIDEIDDDVVEITSVFYRRNSRLLIVEYNHHGARPNALQNYLSSFLPNNEDDNWAVYLEPIESNLGFQDIQNSNDIKRVDFRIDLTSRTRNLYLEDSNESVIGDVLSNTIETHNSFGANVAYVGFGNGRKKKDVIDPVQLVNLLRGLDLDGDIFESVKVKYTSPMTGSVEEVDVKDVGVLKIIRDVEGSGWENITDFLEIEFYQEGRVGENTYNEYTYEPDELPELIINHIDQHPN
ncbi:DUF6731 family protein [Alkalibacillus almallahensis]|uniref:DUF6731 family protein n=1 Tax=Alkalibacillus almallahensis TaxID=1379154 RepID=UPI0014209F64|nr:DUF6731 family protein [Alkalibacillus almallahensis]NIK11516.1 hypothetical protein [Alkalibacillus almallahensis]